jgi:DNA-binding helix-hairpin-helix protein with protein kinase domain
MNAKNPPEVIDNQGNLIRLGHRLGQGGEGAVFEVASNDNTVAKIYHNPLAPERAAKILAMTKMRSEQMEKLTAWPISLVKLRSGQPIGLTMPKVNGHKDAHQLYSPKSRRSEFQKANWQFLIRSASNLARAFASVHEAGCVIGDVNPGGVQVAQDARNVPPRRGRRR